MSKKHKGPPKGYLEVGCNNKGQVVVNHPDLRPDKEGCGHIIFSPEEAINLAQLLIKHADKILWKQRLRP